MGRAKKKVPMQKRIKTVQKKAVSPPTPRVQRVIRQIEEKVRAEQAKGPMTKQEVEQLRQKLFKEIYPKELKKDLAKK